MRTTVGFAPPAASSAREGAPDQWLHAEHIEEAMRDHAVGQLRRLIDAGEVHIIVASTRDRFERCDLLLELAEPRRREALALQVLLHVLRLDRDELVGIRERQRREQHRVHHAEDRGVRANPERQRQDGDDGETRRLAELPESEAEIVHRGGCSLVGAKREHRIEARGATRRQVTSDERSEREHERDDCEGERISRGDSVKQRAQRLRGEV